MTDGSARAEAPTAQRMVRRGVSRIFHHASGDGGGISSQPKHYYLGRSDDRDDLQDVSKVDFLGILAASVQGGRGDGARVPRRLAGRAGRGAGGWYADQAINSRGRPAHEGDGVRARMRSASTSSAPSRVAALHVMPGQVGVAARVPRRDSPGYGHLRTRAPRRAARRTSAPTPASTQRTAATTPPRRGDVGLRRPTPTARLRVIRLRRLPDERGRRRDRLRVQHARRSPSATATARTPHVQPELRARRGLLLGLELRVGARVAADVHESGFRAQLQQRLQVQGRRRLRRRRPGLRVRWCAFGERLQRLRPSKGAGCRRTTELRAAAPSAPTGGSRRAPRTEKCNDAGYCCTTDASGAEALVHAGCAVAFVSPARAACEAVRRR